MSGKRWLIWRRLRRLYLGFRHPATPWWARGLVIFILLYGIGPVDLAILGIGGYDPYLQGHASPEQAWAMALRIPARQILPMHHSTFVISHEPVDEPLRRLLNAAGDQRGRVVAYRIGQRWSID